MSFIATGAMVALIPMRAYAALQDTPIADFPETNGEVYAIAPASDGSVYVGGVFTSIGGVSRQNIARILPDNTIDPDFNPNIFQYSEGGDGAGFGVGVYTIEIGSDMTTLYVGGNFNRVNGEGTQRNNVAEIDAETGVATAFNPNISGSVQTLELDANNEVLYVGGGFGLVNGGTSRKDLAAFSTATGTVTAFDAGINTATCDEGAETVYDLLLDTNTSRLYVAGHFYSVTGNYSPGLASVDSASGTPDEEFSAHVRYSGEDADLGQCPDVYSVEKIGNTLYAGGFFDNVNNGAETRTNFAAFNASTGVATDLDMAFDNSVYDLAIDPISGNLYLGGSFSVINGLTERNEAAAIDVDTGELMSFNPDITTAPPEPSVHAIAFSNRGYFYAGGTFDHVGGEPRASLAAFANPDPDNDDISSEVEDAAPNGGDANNDGTPDAEQPHVTSLVNTETNQYVTVVSPSGTTITTVTTEAAPTEDGFTHLFGLTGFTVTGVTPGATIPIEIFYPNPDNIAADSIIPQKYFPATTTYQDLAGATVTSLDIDTQPTLRLSYSLTDGSTYDLDNTADGQITDPVSLATANTTVGTDQDALADTGQNTSLLILIATTLLIVGLYNTRKMYV